MLTQTQQETLDYIQQITKGDTLRRFSLKGLSAVSGLERRTIFGRVQKLVALGYVCYLDWGEYRLKKVRA